MNGDFREDLKRACEVMQKGGVILYPTDTIWGIGYSEVIFNQYMTDHVPAPAGAWFFLFASVSY